MIMAKSPSLPNPRLARERRLHQPKAMKAKRKLKKSGLPPSIESYLDELNAYSPLSRGEEAVLARRIRQGDQAALDQLVNANLKFVVKVAQSYQGKGLPLEDLISEGNVGLIKAAQRFDETKGFKFISYAVWWIRQAILQALTAHTRVVRLPLNRVHAVLKVARAAEELMNKLGREPDTYELAKQTRMKERDVVDALANGKYDLSLDHPVGDDDHDNLIDFLISDRYAAPDEALMHESLQAGVDKAISNLEPRSAEIMRRYFGLNGYSPHSLGMIGEQLRLTRERIRQIKARALKSLRQKPSVRNLRKYV
jgi:RNA polymerase primary sigma factor